MYASYKFIFLWRQNSVKWADVLKSYFNRTLLLSLLSQLIALLRMHSELKHPGCLITLVIVGSNPLLVFSLAASSLINP